MESLVNGLYEKNTAVILAAGRGTRMKSETPKQFLLLGEHPIIWYSLKAFEDSEIDEMLLVTDEQSISYCKSQFLNTGEFKKLKLILAGGRERYESVYNGLKNIKSPCRNVLIHDGARPFITEKMVDEMLLELQSKRACIFGMPVKDTIKEINPDGYAENTPDRKKLWQIQTPQGFAFPELLSAYKQVLNGTDKSRITDDSMVWEAADKGPVFVMEGSYRNIKITTPEDLTVGKAFLQL